MTNVDSAAIGAEIEDLISRFHADDSPQVAAQVQELVRLVMVLYGQGLSRILDIVRTEQGGSAAILERFATDPLVASLLVLHDLHPQPLQVRIQRALLDLTPHLPDSTQITLVAAETDVVRVAVRRASASTGQSAEAVRLSIERAIRECAPEVSVVQVEGLESLIQVIRAKHGIDTHQRVPS